MADTIFGRIERGEIPTEILYEDDRAIAFRDVNPVAPIHLLVIPRKPIETLSSAEPADESLLGHLLLVANRVAADARLENYRVVINNGAGSGQTVFHLHLHVIGDRPLNWPPG
ncbi:MAG: histidine triad nucleotide-binding protein [Deltaproteobacteria bacterium]|nr:histidine triad nucleotide-binding protein [Deltaproteobacteria bacterium]MBW2694354.1 histidine triad nucleotide-binding protein [Deltaproteobacteria bacterium]